MKTIDELIENQRQLNNKLREIEQGLEEYNKGVEHFSMIAKGNLQTQDNIITGKAGEVEIF